MKLKQVCFWAALVALAVIGLEACRQTPTDTQEPASGEADGAESLADTPSSEGESEVEEMELTLGPGDVDVLDPAAGLANLDSYRATLTVSFDGTEGGEPSQWTNTRTFTRGNNPPVTVEEIDGIDPASGEAILIVMMGDSVYEQDARGGCISYPAEGEAFAAREEPVSALPPVYGADRTGEEVVNGVETVHASFDAQALGIPNVSEADGEVWVAENGLVMRYHLTGSAGSAMLGEGSEGTLTYDYEVNEINPPVSVEVPAACPQGEEVAAPTPPDAQNVESTPGTLRFDSATDIAGIIAFYQQELPATGWEQAQEPITGEGAAVLLFRQGEQELLITLEVTDQGTHVELHQRPIVIPPPPEGTPGIAPTP